MKDFLIEFLRALFEVADDLNKWFCGMFFSVIGYFLPIKDLTHMVIVIFLIDTAVGYWTARKLRKESFNPKIVWDKTIPRMAFSVLLLTLTYWWDTTCNQDYLHTYAVIAWGISGLLIYSIAKNGYKLTKWNGLRLLGEAVEHKIEEETGIDLSKEDI